MGEKVAKLDKRYIMLFFNLNYLAFMDTVSKSNPCVFYENVIDFINLINVTMIVKVLNLYSGICIIEVVPTDTTPYSGQAMMCAFIQGVYSLVYPIVEWTLECTDNIHMNINVQMKTYKSMLLYYSSRD